MTQGSTTCLGQESFPGKWDSLLQAEMAKLDQQKLPFFPPRLLIIVTLECFVHACTCTHTHWILFYLSNVHKIIRSCPELNQTTGSPENCQHNTAAPQRFRQDFFFFSAWAGDAAIEAWMFCMQNACCTAEPQPMLNYVFSSLYE